MAINRYSSPAQAPIANTYIPIPFNDILQAGMAQQERYNQNLSNFEQAQASAEQLKYIPGSQDESYIKGTVLPTFEELADEYATKDFGDPKVIRDLNKRIRGLDRKRISSIQQSYQNYNQYMQDIRKLATQGKTAPYLNQFNSKEFDSQLGIFNQTPEALRDFASTAESYFNQLRDSSYFDPKSGQVISGVSSGTIENVALKNLQEFITSEEGKQAVKAAKYLGDNRNSEEIAYDYLVSRGYEFIRRNVGFAPEYLYQGANDNISIDSASNTQAIKNIYRTDSSELSKSIGFSPDNIKATSDLFDYFSFDDKNNINRKVAQRPAFTTKVSEYNKAKKAGTTTAKDQFEYARQEQQKLYDEDYNKSVKLVKDIRKYNNSFEDMSDLDVLKAYTNAYKMTDNVDFNKYLYNTDKPTTSKREAISRKVIPDIAGRKIINAETGKGSGKVVNTLSDLYDLFDVPSDDRKTENIKITGIVPALGGYSASIEVEGQPRDFIISPNQKEQYITNLVREATAKNLNGIVGEENINLGGKNYIVTTRVSNETDGFGFESNIRTSDGSEIIPGKKSVALNELEAYTANILSQIK